MTSFSKRGGRGLPSQVMKLQIEERGEAKERRVENLRGERGKSSMRITSTVKFLLGISRFE